MEVDDMPCPVCNAGAQEAHSPCVGDGPLLSFVDDGRFFHLARWLNLAAFLHVNYNPGTPGPDGGPDAQNSFWESLWP